MTITQTVEIPADDSLEFEGECPICAAHRDPVSGEERFNAVTLAAMQEAKDIMNGKTQVKWNHSIEEAREELGL